MLLTGRWIKAEEAYNAKLVNYIVPRDKLFDEVMKVAKKLSSYDPIAIRMAKLAIKRGLDLNLLEGIQLENRLVKIIKHRK